MNRKICKNCGKEKDIFCFKPYTKKHGLKTYSYTESICNKCVYQKRKKYLKKYKKANSERQNEIFSNWRRLNYSKYTLNTIKSRARARGIDFNLDESDLILPEKCPVLGIELKLSKGRMSNCSPSVDRIIPSLGYVKGNIAIISWRANSLKKDATLEEIEAVFNYMKKYENFPR